jgi:enediyne biosynthesis protein E4
MRSFLQRNWLGFGVLSVLSGCAPQTAPSSNIQFVDVAASAGIVHRYTTPSANGQALTILETIGRGGAFLDYNADGNLDVLLVDTQPKLYRGDGKGTFQETTQAVGLNNIKGHFLGCAVGDVDNDGWDDVYLSGYRTGVLLRNRGGKRFQDISRSAGVKPQPWGTSCGFTDLDADGWLDLVVCNYVEFGPDPSKYPQRCEPLACTPQMYDAEKPTLYHNLGKGRFRDATASSGLGAANGKGLGVAFADIDDDGDQDILIANDEMPGDLFENQGGMRFVQQGEASGTAFAPDGRVHGGMGADWGDYDRDGKPDALVMTYTDQIKSLYRNRGDKTFEDMAERNGIGKPTLPYVAFGVKWLDADNDGWQDILITNGNVDNKIAIMFPDKSYRQPTQLLHNDGSGQFADVSAATGEALTKPIVGRGLATGDFDNDGKADALVIDNEGAVMLLRNRSNTSAHWLGLTLQGKGKSNRNALGARVTLTNKSGTQTREVQTAGSYLSASDRRVVFGLGADASPVTVVIRWADGQQKTLSSLPLDRYHKAVQGE